MSAKTIIIDTREPFEYAASHVPDAVNISPTQFMSGEFAEKLTDVAKDDPIILYCRSGSRSNVCMHILRDAGYTNLTNGVNEGQVRKLLEK